MADKIKYIKVENTLKEKMGSGGIPAHLLERSQKYLEANPIDFGPHAAAYIGQLIDIKNDAQAGKMPPELALEKIMTIVMQLKANGSMFHYQLISMTSDVLQRFLEKVKILHPDVLDIIDVYTKILNIILNKKLRGNGGKEGYALTKELENACARYNVKYNIT